MLIIATLACTTGDLSQSYVIDRVRVLGVASEPAEPRPGETVTISALIVSPNEDLFGTLFLMCEGADEYGCTVTGDVDLSELDPEALAEAGVIGFEPGLTPTWTVPEDFLDGLSDDERLEGVSATVNLVVIPASVAEGFEAAQGDTGATADMLDNGDVEIAFKRIPVSEAATPNHNPTLAGLRIGGFDVADGSTVVLDADQTYEIEAVLADDAVETYTYRNSEGVDEERTEEPYFLWYLQEGGFDQTATLYPYLSVNYTTPESPEHETAGIWVVVRDRRGGMAWSHIDVVVRSTGS